MKRPETGATRTDWRANAHEAQQRSGVYHLLAALFAEEPSPALISALRDGPLADSLTSIGYQLIGDRVEPGEQDAANALAVEYTRLFLGPGPHLAPYESLYRDQPDSRQLWGESAVRIKRLVQFLGLRLEAGYGGIPDHLSVELEIMRKLTEREAEAWRDRDAAAVTWLLRHEQWLLENHLTQWVPEFCERVQARASLDFYRQAGALLQQFVTVDAEATRASLLAFEHAHCAGAAGAPP